MTLLAERREPTPRTAPKHKQRRKRATSLFANGEPMVWLTGGALALALAMIVGRDLLATRSGADRNARRQIGSR